MIEGEPHYFFKLVGGPMDGQRCGMHEPYDSLKIIRTGGETKRRPGQYVRVGEWVARAEWKEDDS